MLVVVEHRDVHLRLQFFFDLEATRCRDVFQVDPAQCRRDVLDNIYDLIHILSFQTDRECVDAREFLEQQRFTIHDRNGRQAADVPKAQDRRTIGYYGHDIGFVRVFIYIFRIFLDLAARLGYPRCVRRGQVVLCFYFHFAGNRHFPFMLFVHFQGLFIIIHFTTPIYFFQELFSPTILLNTFSVSFVSLLSAM